MFADITINDQEKAFQEQKAILDLKRKALAEAKRVDAKFNKLVNGLKEVFDYKSAYKEILKSMLGFKEEIQKVTTTEETNNIDDFKENDVLNTTTEVNKNTIEEIEETNNIDDNSWTIEKETLVENIDATKENSEAYSPTLEELKVNMLSQTSKEDLEDYKAIIGIAKAIKVWNNCTIPERNSIKMIASRSRKHSQPAAILGYPIQYTNPKTQTKHSGKFLGHYLHGKVIIDENQRAIVINGKGMIVNKQDFRSDKLTSSNTPTADEIQELEFILSQPQPKTYTSSFNNSSIKEEVLVRAREIF